MVNKLQKDLVNIDKIEFYSPINNSYN